MKKWMKISLWILLSAGVTAILYFANQEEIKKKYKKKAIW